MELKLTLGELLTLIVVLAQGVAFYVKFDRRVTILEETTKRIPIIEDRLDDLRIHRIQAGGD